MADAPKVAVYTPQTTVFNGFPWGWAEVQFYSEALGFAIAELFIRTGKQTAVQKETTDCVLQCESGRAFVEFATTKDLPSPMERLTKNEIVVLEPGTTVHIPAGTWHCVRSEGDAYLKCVHQYPYDEPEEVDDWPTGEEEEELSEGADFDPLL